MPCNADDMPCNADDMQTCTDADALAGVALCALEVMLTMSSGIGSCRGG